MLAKGPMPGFSPKKEVQAILPQARCIRLNYGSTYWFEVTVHQDLGPSQTIGRGGNAIKAWEDALVWIEAKQVAETKRPPMLSDYVPNAKTAKAINQGREEYQAARLTGDSSEVTSKE